MAATVARWVVFATFDSAGRASASSVDQIRAYREAGFRVLVVDTSAAPSDARRDDWDREATRWFQRANVGHDFGSYKAGLQDLIFHEGVDGRAADVIITNDSCFGPFIPIGPLIEKFDDSPSTSPRVFGITDSVQSGHHIQSYWMYFRANVLPLAIEFFLHEMRDASSREEAIASGEIALSAFLRSRDCILDVACPEYPTLRQLARFNGWFASTIELGLRVIARRWKYSPDLDKQCLRHLLHYPDKMQHFNPVDLFGVQLHLAGASPFVKKSLMRDNVYRNPVIPEGLDPGTMTNADVRALLHRQARHG